MPVYTGRLESLWLCPFQLKLNGAGALCVLDFCFYELSEFPDDHPYLLQCLCV